MASFRQFKVENEKGVAVLTLAQARIHEHEAIKQLGEELTELTDKPENQQLLFDMAAVEFISSAVLNKLIVLDKQLKSAGGQLAFSGLRPQVAEVFSITRLNQLFPIYESKKQAIEKMSD